MKFNRYLRVIYNLRIKYKLFLAYFLVTILPVFAVGYFSYSISSITVEKESYDLAYQLQQNNIDSINKRLDSYIFLANTIYDNQRMQNFILHTGTDYYDEYITVIDFLEPVASSLLMSTGSGIYVSLIRYNNKGSEIIKTNFEDILGLGDRSNNDVGAGKKLYCVINYNRIEEQPWFRSIKGEVDDYTWMQVNTDRGYGNISLMREMVNYTAYNNEKIGLLRLTVSISEILGKENTGGILDKNFNLIFDRDGNLLSTEEEKMVFYQNDLNKINDFLYHSDNPFLILGERVLVRGEIASPGWRIINAFPLGNITRGTRAIGKIIMICCIISIVFLFFVTFVISRHFSGRIGIIVKKMQSVEKGDFSVRIDKVSRDELGFLANVFNVMIARIGNLIRDNYQASLDKKDAQLRALQSQINPHFLYNSMSAIGRLAENSKRDEIITMVKSLAKFYRMTLSKGMDISELLTTYSLRSLKWELLGQYLY